MTSDETTTARRSARRNKVSRGGGRIPQLPWRDVQLPWSPIAIADEEQVEAIHTTSMRILSELGIRVLSTKVMDLFEAGGALVYGKLLADITKSLPAATTRLETADGDGGVRGLGLLVDQRGAVGQHGGLRHARRADRARGMIAGVGHLLAGEHLGGIGDEIHP